MLIYNKNDGKFYWRGSEITEQEYRRIREIICNKPIPPAGYDYRLTDALEWELVEMPPEPAEDEVAPEELEQMMEAVL